MKGVKAMSKWGVRLVGGYFFVRAILTAYGLILSPFDAGGFFGFRFTDVSYSLPFFGSGESLIDIMALAEVVAFLLIGYFLLHYNSIARLAALIILWPPTIVNGFYFILMSLVAIFSLFDSEAKASATLRFFQWSRHVNDPLILLLAFTGFFLFYSTPIYLLMRKDIKALFQKVATTGETH